MADTRYLEVRRQCFYVVIEVPPSARPAMGRKRLRKSLKTRSLETAQKRRWEAIAELRGQIEAARLGSSEDRDIARAQILREALEEAQRADDDGPEHGQSLAEIVRDQIEAEDAALAQRRPLARAIFRGVAQGTATPLLLHVDRWLAEGGQHGPYEERTKRDHRRAVDELAEWLGKPGRPGATLEVVTRPVAGRFVSEHLIPSGRANKTTTKIISALSSYWTWLRRRGHVADDQRLPWADQSPPKKAREGHGKELERAFTDAEVATLLAGPAPAVMIDFLRVALLSGMRREEIGRLTVADCQGGVFIVQKGKTDAARRRVPVHSDLADLVARRAHGKAATAYLFHDVTSERAERTDPLGKAFTRYRRTLGIEGGTGRRSTVNLHSARRWFVTAAINASRPPHMVSLVVGHSEGRKGMTLGRYWTGADDQALREVVEAVLLPSEL